jgi:thiol-disulfide isomerase/thioredoxin
MSPTRSAALIVGVVFVGALATFQGLDGGPRTPEIGSSVSAQEDLSATGSRPENFGPAPELAGLDGWLQTDGDSFETVKGDVTIVQFWTYTCHNCTATIPFLQQIYAQHHDGGLEIIGVHAPEFEREKDPVGIQEAADRLGVSWPIALDTEKRNFRAWQGSRRFWPRTYVIDQNGDVRFDKIGEGKYAELEATVAHLLANGA